MIAWAVGLFDDAQEQPAQPRAAAPHLETRDGHRFFLAAINDDRQTLMTVPGFFLVSFMIGIRRYI
jgi:hypothetical protein